MDYPRLIFATPIVNEMILPMLDVNLGNCEEIRALNKKGLARHARMKDGAWFQMLQPIYNPYFLCEALMLSGFTLLFVNQSIYIFSVDGSQEVLTNDLSIFIAEHNKKFAS
jgi:hypothetical protein